MRTSVFSTVFAVLSLWISSVEGKLLRTRFLDSIEVIYDLLSTNLFQTYLRYAIVTASAGTK
jgi:hypothetical protein